MLDRPDLSIVRRDYESTGIVKSDLDADPFMQFEGWLHEAINLDLIDATAMTLATATLSGVPSARVVLLKGFDKDGFCWYTDSRSRKGRELAQNPQAALLFHWRDLSRQIRVQGSVEQLSAEQAEEYFHSRPLQSRFSAAASCQSSEVENRKSLEDRVERLKSAYPHGEVPRPEDWIGYRLRPVYFEFWQGQVNRLHDRIVYRPQGDGWVKSRISP